MRNLTSSIGLLFMLSLVGCGNFWDEENPPEVKDDVQIENAARRKILLESEILNNHVSLGQQQAGNIIELYLVGTRYTPQFTNIIDRNYQSRWTKRVCIRDPICRMCLTPKLMECFENEYRGTCTHKYREQMDNVKSPFLFDEDAKNISVKFKIGNNTYPIGIISDHQGAKIVSRFKLSNEMLSESSEVFLIVTPESVNGNVQTGFLGFGRCDGQGQRSFSSGGPTGSRQIPNQDKIEFKASVVVEYPREVK
ncbi:MAG: hypothetical protein H6622_07620 [Halobacteriovoraceae bacterium]|nr:hypothetical protein [Halobacteriovoraceae bacterium]